MKNEQHQSRCAMILCGVLVLLGTVIVIPVPFFEFVLPKFFLFSLAAFVGAVAVLLRAQPQDFLPLIGTRQGRALLLFFLVVFLSTTWSFAPMVSLVGASPRFEGVFSYSIFFALGLCAMVLVRQEHGRKTLLMTILISNAIVVLYGFMQILNLDPLRIFWQEELFLGRIFSTIGQPNFLGQFILLTVPFTFLAIVREGGWKRMFWSMIGVINFFVLLGTASRGALLGLFVAGMFLLLVLITPSCTLNDTNSIQVLSANNAAERYRHLNSRLSSSLLVSFIQRSGIRGRKNLISQLRGNRLIGGFVLLVLISAVAFVSFSTRFSVSTQERLSLGARGVMWESALEMIRARPIGYGLETVGIVSPRFMSPELLEFESLTTQVDRVHSKPLDLLLTLGPLGFLAFYSFLILLLLAMWKKRKDALILVCFLGLIGESVTVLVGFDTAVTHVYFWMIAGMGLGLSDTGIARVFPRLQKFLLWILTLIVLLSIVLFGKWLYARTFLAESEKFFANAEYSAAIQAGVGSVQQFPFDRSSQVRTAEKALLALEQTEDLQAQELLHQVVDFCLKHLGQVSNGHDGMIPLLRAWQAALKGENENVQDHIIRAIELQPNSVTTYRIAAHAFDILGDALKKEEMEKELVEILPPWWNDPVSEKGRILRKENPWVEELIVKSE